MLGKIIISDVAIDMPIRILINVLDINNLIAVDKYIKIWCSIF
ncbi:MAG: hypothetical protein DK305_001136 [Chloroflexi bacterium]|jgi:hypothetical protein|nr:MAG: hypothetical protein DK305_001136 [Chloroflexota bacterium]|tara:strand:- start:2407 stop:2535 length:129 start_codon:yes stop_codon:yes gene_type:complete